MGKDTELVKDALMEKKEKQSGNAKDLQRLSKEGKDTTATTGIGTGLRFNQGKLRYDLVEPRAHRDMVEVLTDGAAKYFARN